MAHRIPATHPLRFLLYLEWILLAIVAISEVYATHVLRLPRLPIVNALGLATFAALGLSLPTQHRAKLLYTGLEFGLIALVSFLGSMRLFVLLYVVLVIRNCLILDRWQRTLVTALAILCSFATQLYRVHNKTLLATQILSEQIGLVLLTALVMMGLVVAFLQLLVDAVLSERRSRQQLAAANTQLATANAQLRNYALRIEELATLQERNRIAREIHDSLGHSLTVLNVQLEAAVKLWQTSPQEATEFLREAKQQGSRALQDVRQSVAALRADPLQGQSLAEAIAGLIEEFQRSTGITPTCELNLQPPLPPELKPAIYRILQESLTNICKHAQATTVGIRLELAQEVYLCIWDNGLGFDPAQTTTGFGLQGMQERVAALLGTFAVTTAPAAGCRIEVHLPLPHSDLASFPTGA